MTPTRRRRLLFILLLIGAMGVATAFTLQAFKENMLYFHSPTVVMERGDFPPDRVFRLGGIVAEGSVQREPGSMVMEFVLTDCLYDIRVSYDRVPPDLFREGQGIIAHGRMTEEGYFLAHEIMAKHDENYMSPELHAALQEGRERAELSHDTEACLI